MAANKQAEKLSAQATPKKGSPKVKRRFTLRQLWRTMLWGATAAGALFLAVLSTRSEVGSERIATVFSSSRALRAARTSDEQAETRRLAAAVQDLATENGELRSRLAAVEQNMSDITGSVGRQIQAAKAATEAPWPADPHPSPLTPTELAAISKPSTPAVVFGTSIPSSPVTVSASEAASEPASPPSGTVQYGVDIGSAASIEVLRARWLGIRSAHRELFEGLTPVVELHESAKSKRVELRLVAGPLANADAAARLCAALAPYRLPCRPTAFDRQHLALQ